MSLCSKATKLSVLTAVLALFVGLILCPDVYAGKPKSSSPAAPGEGVMVTAVDAAAKQVTITLKKTSQKFVYTVDDFTKITVEGNAATLSEVHSGQEVYSYTERDTTTLDSIDVGPVRTEPKASP